MLERGPTPAPMPEVHWLQSDDRSVPREVFPLPAFDQFTVPLDLDVSRTVFRRLEKRQHVGSMVNDCIRGLNALYSGGKVESALTRRPPSAVQQKIFEHVLNSVKTLGPPPRDLSGSEALQQLRAFDGYGEDQMPCSVRPYSPQLLSLPSCGNQAVPLEKLMGEEGCSLVDEFIRTRLLPQNEARRNVRASGLREAYSDPRLREPDTYSSFVQRLVDADLVEIVRERWVEKIEVFFVAKKDGRLRMVCDCRLSNCHFAKPDKVRLCTAEALTRVELPAGSQLHIATADLKDAFYHFQLPLELRSYFGMRGLHAGELGVAELDGIAISANELVYPRLKVLPMGWSHALFWCQRLHQKIVGAVGAGPDSCLEDKVALPNSECMHLEYVDNYVCLGTDQKQVEALSAAGVRALRQKGLVVHEIESVSTDQEPVKVLGWQFSGTKIQPVPLRVWRVRLGIEEILRIGNVPGRQLEKVVGHAAFICLGRRESLSIFGETYTFIQRHYHMRHRLWSSVRRELQIFCWLLPLIWRDLSSEWSEQVTAVDASN